MGPAMIRSRGLVGAREGGGVLASLPAALELLHGLRAEPTETAAAPGGDPQHWDDPAQLDTPLNGRLADVDEASGMPGEQVSPLVIGDDDRRGVGKNSDGVTAVECGVAGLDRVA